MPSCGTQRLNSGCQTWQQSPLPREPSCPPSFSRVSCVASFSWSCSFRFVSKTSRSVSPKDIQDTHKIPNSSATPRFSVQFPLPTLDLYPSILIKLGKIFAREHHRLNPAFSPFDKKRTDWRNGTVGWRQQVQKMINITKTCILDSQSIIPSRRLPKVL